MSTQLDSVNVEYYRRQSFLEALNEDFAALRAQPEGWEGEMEERKFWEQTLMDGLEKSPLIEE